MNSAYVRGLASQPSQPLLADQADWQHWELQTKPKVAGGMGFRDLRLFNLAMLGKLGWRLLQNPDSLCARVLKGRYYHDTDFLHANRKKHSSHTRRAILEGR